MTILLSLLTAYAIPVSAMYLLQRKLMYFPDRKIAAPAEYGLEGFDDIRLTSPDGARLQAWYRKPDVGKPLLVYFHGNASHLGNRAGMFAALAANGFGILGLSYRGYGLSEGSPDEQGVMDDARTAMRYALSLGYQPHQLVLYGESLGTGVAVRMASEFDTGALALQSPYTSVIGRAADIYWYIPVRWLIKDKFESLAFLQKLHVPTIIFHGERDTTIPISHGHAMLAAPQGVKEGVFFPDVGHTDFDSATVTAKLFAFVQKHLAP